MNESFTSANAFPIKILLDKSLMYYVLNNKYVSLKHLQVCPTNSCNLNCSFCSCKNRKKEEEINFEVLKKTIDIAKTCDCGAVTITGGGEPLLYPKINELIEYCNKLGIQVGLTTNGLLLKDLKNWNLEWIRVSLSDESNETILNLFESFVEEHDEIDWSFSYVLTENVKKKFLVKIIEFANKNNFTHVRIVSDLFGKNQSSRLGKVKSFLEDKVNCNKVIFQHRLPKTGNKNCWISLLKPLVAPDGYVYPCCGVQYAQNENKTFPKKMRICKAEELENFVRNQIPFDGSNCVNCYYSEYNDLIELLLKDIKHEVFI